MTRTAERFCWIALTVVILLSAWIGYCGLSAGEYPPRDKGIVTDESPDGRFLLTLSGPLADQTGGIYDIELTDISQGRIVRYVRVRMAEDEVSPASCTAQWETDRVRFSFDPEATTVDELLVLPLPRSGKDAQ
jgi:hypothetical protein